MDPATDFGYGSFWASDAKVVVSLHSSARSPACWRLYVDGLVRTYQQYSVGCAIDKDALERQGSSLFWLMRSPAGKFFGGMRTQGPFDDAQKLPGLRELESSPDYTAIPLALQMRGLVAEEKVMELNGGWAEPGGPRLGDVIARCAQHSLWWMGIRFGFANSAKHTLKRWRSSGGVPLEGIRPATYPTPEYKTVPLLWDIATFSPDSRVASRLESEQHFLASARNDFLGISEPAATLVPEFLITGDHRIAELERRGISAVDQFDQLHSELEAACPEAARQARHEPSWWVFYPWKSQATRLPGPVSYRQAIANRQGRQIPDQRVVRSEQTSVGIIGTSLGSSLAISIARQGVVGVLKLANTTKSDYGVCVDALAEDATAQRLGEYVLEEDPYLKVDLESLHASGSSIGSFMAGLDAVADCSTSTPVKRLIRTEAAKRGIPVISNASDLVTLREYLNVPKVPIRSRL